MGKIMIHHISKTIMNGESDTLDFKQNVKDASKIAKTLVAFANGKGGKLLIGVKDNGSISGVKNEDDLYMLEMAAQIYCKPEIKMNFKEHHLEGKTILEAEVKNHEAKPYMAKDEHGKWWVYTRIKDKTMKASAVQYLVIKKQNQSHNNKFEYSFVESKIIELIKKNELISLNELHKEIKISRRRLIYSLAKLVCYNIIEIISENQQEKFKLV